MNGHIFALVISIALSMSALRALANDDVTGAGEEKGGSCKQFQCGNEKDREKRSVCAKEKAACLRGAFAKRLAKWKEDGLAEDKKAKIIEHISKKIEKLKERERIIQEHISHWESDKKEVEAIKVKTAGKK